MKKIMIVLVSIFIVIGMSGCFENPTSPATVYDPTPTATPSPEESVTPEETPVTETWRVEIEGDPGTTFEFGCASVDNGNANVLFEIAACQLDSNGDWNTTTFEFNQDFYFSYTGEVTGTIPDSFIVYLYKNGVNIATETVYPHVSPDPNFGCSTN